MTETEPDAQTPGGPDAEPLSEPQIRRLLAGFVDEDRQSVGVVAGVTSAEGCVVVGYGRLSADDPTRPDGDTVFEIGSITKVFTSTLLADLVSREELGLDTAVEMTPAPRERPAAGHDGRLRPAANWGLPVLAGAGALRSTVNDLLTFLEANLGLRESLYTGQWSSLAGPIR